MALFWLLFVFSTVNVGLGYALAVYLGYGLPNLRDAWIALGVDRSLPKAPAEDPIPTASESPALAFDPQDRPFETDPAGCAAQEPWGDSDEIAAAPLPDAIVEYGGGAT